MNKTREEGVLGKENGLHRNTETRESQSPLGRVGDSVCTQTLFSRAEIPKRGW